MTYRPDIDGLRAVAVLSVILFHAGLAPFSGGFIGVDVFFVISGFLITTLIQRDLAAGRFSLSHFYERRARRILPALVLVVLATILGAWFILYPAEMEDFGESVTSIPLFLSNVLFWDQSGYFDTAAELKPLLHTWSLAVEEQFYIFFPLILMALWRFGLRVVLVTLAVIFAASLVYALWASRVAPETAFFMIMSRAWELLVGCFAAFALAYRPTLREMPGGPWLAALGLVMVIIPVFTFDSETPTPGLPFLIPTLGTALILIFGHSGGPVGRILSQPLVVGVGLISYSAYLWHQPLFAFTRYVTVMHLPLWQIAGLITLTFALAYVTYRLVETPFRRRDFLSRRAVFRWSGAALLLVFVLGLVIDKSDGFANRFSREGLPERVDIECHLGGTREDLIPRIDDCLGTTGDGRPGTLFLLGDSHAAQLTFPLRLLAEERGVDLRFMNADVRDRSFFPFSFIYKDSPGESLLLDRVITLADPGDVLIFTFYRSRLNETYNQMAPLDRAVAATPRSQNLERNLRAVLPDLRDAGLRVILVEDTPFLGGTTSIERCIFNAEHQYDNGCAVTFAQDDHDRTLQSDIFARLAADFPDFVSVIDPLPTIYGGSDSFVPVAPDGFIRMRDQHHLTRPEAEKLLPFFRANIP